MGRQMEVFRHSYALRAIALASAMAWFAPAAELGAATRGADIALGRPDMPIPAEPPGRSGEPFGLLASSVSAGTLRDKWLVLERKLDDERVQLALCDGDRDSCLSPAAMQLLAIVDNARAREGRARLGEINRAINLAIRPMSDLTQYGAMDVWSSPLVTFATGAGDCEDYAVAKFVALRQAGVSPEDLRIVIIRDAVRGEDHAVVAARLEGRWLMLDNRRMTMIEDVHFRNSRPLFVIDQHGVMQYGEPLLATASKRDQLSPVALNLSVKPGLISQSN
jgi:predicted transglutaminase-like cysteine proteinase